MNWIKAPTVLYIYSIYMVNTVYVSVYIYKLDPKVHHRVNIQYTNTLYGFRPEGICRCVNGSKFRAPPQSVGNENLRIFYDSWMGCGSFMAAVSTTCFKYPPSLQGVPAGSFSLRYNTLVTDLGIRQLGWVLDVVGGKTCRWHVNELHRMDLPFFEGCRRYQWGSSSVTVLSCSIF